MEKYYKLHLYMIIPIVIMQLGIAMDYWGEFTDNTWAVHIHYWSGTVWYLFLIIQPYYAAHGKIEKHRTNGMIGIFIAGSVGLGSLSMLHRDIRLAHLAMEFPEKFGPFKAWFFYGVPVVETVMICAFMYAVIKSIVYRKDLANHAWWHISTVFLIMMPALGRGVQFIQIMISGFTPDLNAMVGIYISAAIIIGFAIVSAIKYNKLKHPATILIICVNLFNCLLEPVGKSEVIQNILETVIKG